MAFRAAKGFGNSQAANSKVQVNFAVIKGEKYSPGEIVKIYPREDPAIIIEIFVLSDRNNEIVVQYQDGETVSYMKDELEEKGRIEKVLG